MPTYQYQCKSCGHDLEAFQRFSDAPLTKCPECGGKLRKVFSAVGVVFKGSGFYATDNRAKPKGASKVKNKEKSEAGSSAKTEPKTESAASGKSSDSSASSSSAPQTVAA